MGINFNELPDSNPSGLVDKGSYFATIETAEMKQGKDPAKPPYLNLRLALTNKDGKSCGKLYDILADSDHQIVKYKIKRFITALEIPMEGEFELKDLVKIIVGKKLIVDVTHDEKGERPKAVVDMFGGMIFYPMAEAGNVFDSWVDTTNETIQAPDADDVIASEEY